MNTDKDGNASCLKANYYKMAAANFIGHSNDGLKATCIMEKDEKYLIKEPLRIPEATQKGYTECNIGGVFDASYPTSKTRRGRVQENGMIAPALTASGEPLNYYEGIDESQRPHFRIRKLTPRECFRLQDCIDSDIDKIQEAGISNSQQYKLAGNSIAVCCLYHIFRKLFIETKCESQQLSLF